MAAGAGGHDVPFCSSSQKISVPQRLGNANTKADVRSYSGSSAGTGYEAGQRAAQHMPRPEPGSRKPGMGLRVDSAGRCRGTSSIVVGRNVIAQPVITVAGGAGFAFVG